MMSRGNWIRARKPRSRWASRLLLALAGTAAACAGGGSGGGTTGGGSTSLTFSGPAAWTITGPQGGPFTNVSNTLTLENPGDQPVAWSVTTIPPFLHLGQTSGILQPHAQISLDANLDPGVAQGFTAGDYLGTLTINNDTGPQTVGNVECTLTVQSAETSGMLLPANNFTAQGPASGPIEPASTLYSLRNTGTAVLTWQATTPDEWLSVAPASGRIAPGDSAEVTVSIDARATESLPIGIHPSVVQFQNTASGAVLDTRSVNLNVLALATAGGWTVFTPSVDTRMVYVSSSTGNDSFNGLTSATAKRSIAAGKTLMRNGFPDWLLLKAGDTWDEALGNWSASGRSLAERMLVSSYGTGARPLLRTGTANGLTTAYQSNPNHLAVVGLEFFAHTYNGSNGNPLGVNWLYPTDNFLLEDCYIHGYSGNINVQGYPDPGRHRNVTIRRNVIADSFTTANGGSTGFFAYSCDGLVIEENVFDRNGWNLSIPGSAATWYSHNGYVSNGSTGVVLRGNIVTGTDGIMMRSGGTVEDNLYLGVAVALLFGQGNFPEQAGISGVIRRNVMLDGNDYGAPNFRGWFVDMGNVAQATVEENIVAHNVHGHMPTPFNCNIANGWQGNTRGVENTIFRKNIVYDWGGSFTFQGDAAHVVNVQFTGNTLQNLTTASPLISHNIANSTQGVTGAGNIFWSSLPQTSWFMAASQQLSFAAWKLQVHDTTSTARLESFPDPNRTIATYNAKLGGAPTFEDFMAEARKQSRANWRGRYTAGAVNSYIRQGFGL